MNSTLSPVLGLLFLTFVMSCDGGLGPAGGWVWTPASTAPVFTKLTTPEEDKGIGSPDVIVENSGTDQGYTMVYAQGGTDTLGRIGLATSPDGITWTRISATGTVLEPSPTGQARFDDHFLDTPSLIHVGSTYYLYYFGDTDNDAPGGQIGLATSTDGVTFTRASTAPVLTAGPSGAWDGLWVESPDVIYDGTQFVMYYSGQDANWVTRVGRATSPDGLTWTKDTANPLLDKGGSTEWDSYQARVPGALWRQGVTELYYCSMTAGQASWFLDNRHPKIGLATSTANGPFVKYAGNPVVRESVVNYALDGPYNPCVVFNETTGKYMLWMETGVGFFLATADPRP